MTKTNTKKNELLLNVLPLDLSTAIPPFGVFFDKPTNHNHFIAIFAEDVPDQKLFRGREKGFTDFEPHTKADFSLSLSNKPNLRISKKYYS